MKLIKSYIDKDVYFIFDEYDEIKITIKNGLLKSEKTLTNEQMNFLKSKKDFVTRNDKLSQKSYKKRLYDNYKRFKTFDTFEDFLINQILKLKNNENNRQTVSNTNRRH